MEIFLLLLDELDDAAAVLRSWLPQLLSLSLACGLFLLSVLAAMRWPVMAGAILLLALLTRLPALRLLPGWRFKTDP
jgi:hypothetical protein